MPGFGSSLVPVNDYDDSTSSSYNMLFLFAGLVTAICVIAAVVAEKNNRLNFDNHLMRIIAGTLTIMMKLMHLQSSNVPAITEDMQLMAIGPHRTGWEGIAVTATMEGTPPRFFATNYYNFIPLVGRFLQMCNVITVDANAKAGGGQSANAKALETADQVIKNKGRIAIFPQGRMVKKGEKAPMIYSGAAKLAVENNIPIYVNRLDGFNCLEIPVIPQFIRNNSTYRAFLSALFPNNIRMSLNKIDFHLRPENSELDKSAKMDGINAELYAYFRHIEELSDEQVGEIKKEISDKTHLSIWQNKVKLDKAEREVKTLTAAQAELEKPKSKVTKVSETQQVDSAETTATLSKTI